MRDRRNLRCGVLDMQDSRETVLEHKRFGVIRGVARKADLPVGSVLGGDSFGIARMGGSRAMADLALHIDESRAGIPKAVAMRSAIRHDMARNAARLIVTMHVQKRLVGL